jgi:hypothetical protein
MVPRLANRFCCCDANLRRGEEKVAEKNSELLVG